MTWLTHTFIRTHIYMFIQRTFIIHPPCASKYSRHWGTFIQGTIPNFYLCFPIKSTSWTWLGEPMCQRHAFSLANFSISLIFKGQPQAWIFWVIEVHILLNVVFAWAWKQGKGIIYLYIHKKYTFLLCTHQNILFLHNILIKIHIAFVYLYKYETILFYYVKVYFLRFCCLYHVYWMSWNYLNLRMPSSPAFCQIVTQHEKCISPYETPCCVSISLHRALLEEAGLAPLQMPAI